jgi:hypothetical protein
MPPKRKFQWVAETVQPLKHPKNRLPWVNYKKTIIRKVREIGLPDTIEYMKRKNGFFAE